MMFVKLISALLFSLFISLTVFASGKAQSNNWILSQSEFKRIPRSDQIQYLDLIFDLLSKAERSKKIEKRCIVGGAIVSRNKFTRVGYDCRVKNDRCLRGEVQCAGYLGSNQCVNANTKNGTTGECYRLVTDKEPLAKLFQESISADVWNAIAGVIYEFCKFPTSKADCSKVKSQSLEVKEKLNTSRPQSKQSLIERSLYPFLISRLQIYSFILGSVAFAQPQPSCHFDSESQIFYGRDGRKTQFHFAAHAGPGSVGTFYGDTISPGADVAAAARKLINANKHNNDKMVSNSQNVYERLKKGEIKWLGHEEDHLALDKLGGTVGLMSRMWEREVEFKTAGLSEGEVQTALIDLYGSSVYGYFKWAKEQPNPKLATEKVRIIGVDNNRNDKVDQLQDEEKRIERAMEREYKAIRMARLNAENDEFLDEFFKTATFKFDAPELQALTRLHESSYKVSPDLKLATKSYLELLNDKIDVRTESAILEEQELKVRDFGMARDVEKNSSEGLGYVTLGSGHLPGVTQYLISRCKDGIGQMNREPVDSSTPSRGVQ